VSDISPPCDPPSADSPCVHCGTRCGLGLVVENDQPFCCRGCAVVYGILHQNQLGDFYQIEKLPGVKPQSEASAGAYDFLADPEIKRKLLDFTDGRTSRITLHLPQIHCVACVWLLERLFKLHDGIGQPEVNFTRKTLMIPFEEEKITLVELATLLSRLGYTPDLKLQDLSRKSGDNARRRAWMQLGIAGFAFGNIMMLSFPSYFGLRLSGSGQLTRLFGFYSLFLSIPVLLYSAQDYFRSAYLGLKHRELSIDIPIAAGILALFFQSLHDILRNSGEGYLDSLAGLVFFLLIGKSFQRRGFDALSFDRDYTHYFPLAAQRLRPDGSCEMVALDRLEPGDRLRIRNNEIIPADSILLHGPAVIDYSFVTGEARPEDRSPGETLYAGGRHHGPPIDVDVVKAVNQGYLTSLWNHKTFRKENERRFDRMTQAVSRWFIRLVLGIALLTGLVWLFLDASQALRVLSAILIVACPCALALAAPFAFGTALRIFRSHGLYLKNGFVVEGMARIKHLAFDKTGTLTRGGLGGVRWDGPALDPALSTAVCALARASTHPLARAIADFLEAKPFTLTELREHSGRGVESIWESAPLRLGSRAWLLELGLDVPPSRHAHGETWLAHGSEVLGAFRFEDSPREGLPEALPSLKGRYDLTVLTGDRVEGLRRLREWFPGCEDARPGLSPADKLEAIDSLRADGRAVMMLGDGLNDAGALRHSDVGVAVAEDVQSFSPACDAILDANRMVLLPRFLQLARLSTVVVRICFGISLLYNIVGISIAASGGLSPLVAAILMPLSSVSVLLVSVTGVNLAARFCGLSRSSS
jgi:Cu+-exporting ATPase